MVGVKLSAVERQSQDVIFYYSETGSEHSYEAARFQVASMTDTWTRFSIAVRDDKVAFYFNCDPSPEVKRIERSPDDMELDRGSGVFVGQAGGPDPEGFLVCTRFKSNVVFYSQFHCTTDFSTVELG